MRKADMRLNDADIEAIFEQGLHEFLSDFIADNFEIGRAVETEYRFSE